jgi:4-hydroxybenzoyl-CoA thioesterase/acyl-CoA thioester hydrolase
MGRVADPGIMREFDTRRRIEFVDTDQGGIVHFSRFFVFMETAEHQFLEALGSSVDLVVDGHRLGWPRVAARCSYTNPARFGDTLDIRVRVVRKGRTSLTYAFEFRCADREIAQGEMTSVCCELEPGRPVRPVPIPEALAARIGG